MRKWQAMATFALVAGLATAAPAPAQQGATRAPTTLSILTAEDYIEIQQLVSRYGFALDTGEDNGYQFADLFTDDGSFGRAKGREQLAALARGGRRGPRFVRNFSTFAIITPTPEGATGVQYAQAIDFWEDGRPIMPDHFGHYEDVYVKMSQGWRFRSRTFVNESQAAAQPAQSRPSR
jgi:hypothetical protein